MKTKDITLESVNLPTDKSFSNPKFAIVEIKKRFKEDPSLIHRIVVNTSKVSVVSMTYAEYFQKVGERVRVKSRSIRKQRRIS